MKSDEIVNQLKVKQAKEINLLKENFDIEQKVYITTDCNLLTHN